MFNYFNIRWKRIFFLTHENKTRINKIKSQNVYYHKYLEKCLVINKDFDGEDYILCLQNIDYKKFNVKVNENRFYKTNVKSYINVYISKYDVYGIHLKNVSVISNMYLIIRLIICAFILIYLSFILCKSFYMSE